MAILPGNYAGPPLDEALSGPQGAQVRTDLMHEMKVLEAQLRERVKHGSSPADYTVLNAAVDAARAAYECIAQTRLPKLSTTTNSILTPQASAQEGV